MNRHTKIILASSMILIVVFACPSVFAQAQAPAPVQPPTTGGFLVRPLWTEIIITVLMFGATLFAIGRSSNRS